jgi:hypothetical protein
VEQSGLCPRAGEEPRWSFPAKQSPFNPAGEPRTAFILIECSFVKTIPVGDLKTTKKLNSAALLPSGHKVLKAVNDDLALSGSSFYEENF